MMRSCRLAAVALGLALAGAGCEGDGGAVSVRWRIVDLSTLESFDPGASPPMGVADRDGSCCRLQDPSTGACSPGNPYVVQTVAITLRDPITGATVLDEPPSNCTARERTTPFTLPAGTFAIGLTATCVDGLGNPAPVALPPPEIRTIVRGAVVNLEVIEVGVHPLPQPTPTPPVNPPTAPLPLPRPAHMVTF
jgi:hypothetical protein